MHYLRLFSKSALRRHLTCGISATALVASLTIYQRAVVANPLTVTEKHWQAIASANLDRTMTRYSPDAVLLWNYGTLDRVYKGSDIDLVWQEFFSQYQIQNYQITEQKQGDRFLQAEITLSAKPNKGSTRVFSISYQVQVDEQGKIIREIWRTNPKLNV